MFQDLRLALRRLRENKGFTAAAVLTLALGIGANTAIFTLVDDLMLKSLPVKDPAQLYRLGNSDNCCVIGGRQSRFSIFAYPLYLDLRDHAPEFASMTAFQADHSQVGVRRGSGPRSPSSTSMFPEIISAPSAFGHLPVGFLSVRRSAGRCAGGCYGVSGMGGNGLRPVADRLHIGD
jgi:hypothetical protein